MNHEIRRRVILMLNHREVCIWYVIVVLNVGYKFILGEKNPLL